MGLASGLGRRSEMGKVLLAGYVFGVLVACGGEVAPSGPAPTTPPATQGPATAGAGTTKPGGTATGTASAVQAIGDKNDAKDAVRGTNHEDGEEDDRNDDSQHNEMDHDGHVEGVHRARD
jgi:hypothetical protein